VLLFGPFYTAKSITLKQFHAKINQIERSGASSSVSGYCRSEFKDGKPWIYDLNFAAHEDVAGVVFSHIVHGLGEHSFDFAYGASPMQ
jgi:hypothetical protein